MSQDHAEWYGRVVDPTVEPVPGYYNGRHHTEWVDQVKTFRRGGYDDLALGLLAELAKAAEDEAASTRVFNRASIDGAPAQLYEVSDDVLAESSSGLYDRPVPPWPYQQMAIIYRAQGRHDLEVEVLERYLSHAPRRGRAADAMAERLAVVRSRVARPDSSRHSG